jgi:hypothetical protein
MSDLKTFSRRIRLRGEAVAKNTDRLVRKVILAVDQAVVISTPVDTGRARLNWRPQIGSAATEALPVPSTPSAGLNTALAEGVAVVARYKGGRVSPVVHITNNLPYIQRLDEGHSKQAPIGFVHTAVLTATGAIKNVKVTTL